MNKQENGQLDVTLLVEEYDNTIKGLMSENIRLKTFIKQLAKQEAQKMQAEQQAAMMEAPPAAPAAPVVEIIEDEEQQG